MGFKREDIRDTSPLSLKKLNDTLRYLWLHSFGNIDFADLSETTQGIINNKVGNTTFTQAIDEVNGTIATKVSDNEFGSKIEQASSSVKIAIGQIGGSNLIKNSTGKFDYNYWTKQAIMGNPVFGLYTVGERTYFSIDTVSGNDQGVLSSDTQPMKPNQKYTLSLELLLHGLYGYGMYILVEFYNSSYTSLGDTFNLHGYLNPTNTVQDTWTNDKFTFQSPSNAAYCKIYCGVRGTGYGCFSRIKLEEGENATAWSPNADEFKTTDVTINSGGATITNGALTLKNSNSTVVIDGQSNMHKIVATGTIALNMTSGQTYNEAYVTHSLGFIPIINAYYYFSDGSGRSIPLPCSDVNSSGVVNFYVSMTITTYDVKFFVKRTAGQGAYNGTIKYYIYKEAAI